MSDTFVFKKTEPPVIDDDGRFLPAAFNNASFQKMPIPVFEEPVLGFQPEVLDRYDGIDGEAFTEDGLFLPVAFEEPVLG